MLPSSLLLLRFACLLLFSLNKNTFHSKRHLHSVGIFHHICRVSSPDHHSPEILCGHSRGTLFLRLNLTIRNKICRTKFWLEWQNFDNLHTKGRNQLTESQRTLPFISCFKGASIPETLVLSSKKFGFHLPPSCQTFPQSFENLKLSFGTHSLVFLVTLVQPQVLNKGAFIPYFVLSCKKFGFESTNLSKLSHSLFMLFGTPSDLRT